VLSGGSSLGAVQVGMLQALADGGLWPPDLLVGTSVGALNAAFVAGHPSASALDELRSIWTSLRRRDVFPARALGGLVGFAGRSDHVVSPDGLRLVLENYLTFSMIEDASIPLHIVATEVTSGNEVVLSSGPALTALLASAAIPGVFPPVEVDGRTLFDGGVANNTPISSAVSLGADTIYVLPGSYPCPLAAPPPTALGVIVQAINLMVHARLAQDVDRYEPTCNLMVVPPLCPLSVSPVDFRHSASLVAQAYESTTRWLSRGSPEPGQAAMLTRAPS
jgi:NTE family protein